MKGNNKDSAWIFLSHSHKDIEKVRFIRNEFEKLGHNPLIFFLKCLNDTSELDDLIKREINERNWFILCDSPNAKASKWVQEEVEMINSLEGKVFKTISLEDDIATQLKKITQFSKITRIFISYSFQDSEIARKISYSLQRYQEYSTFLGDDNLPLQTNLPTIEIIISEIRRHGFFLFLVTKNILTNAFCLKELLIAMENNTIIIPIYLEPYNEIMQDLPIEASKLSSIPRGIDFSNGEFETNMNELITQLNIREVSD